MEEISLKEIMVVLLKGKKWLLLTTLAFIAASLAYGLIQPKIYASETVLKVSAININPIINNDASLIGDITAIAQFPVMDINSYAQQIVNNQVLEGTILALDLRNKKGELIKAEALKSKITVTADEKTSILHVSAKDKTPQSASDIANTLTEQLKIYLTKIINDSCAETSENISRQMEAQKEKIDAATEQLKAYAESPNNARELESATENLIAQMTQYKSDLNDMERSLQADGLALTSLKNTGTTGDTSAGGVSSSQLKINLPVAGARSRYATNGSEAVPTDGGAPMEIIVESESDVENIMLAVKKAELETRLVQNEAEYNALLASLSVMKDDLSQMTSTLAEEQQKYQIMQRDFLLAGEIYGKYQKIYQQIPVIAASDLARKNIQVLSYGIAASRPENPGVLLCAAVGGVLGLFVSMIAILFKNYWAQA